MKPPSARKLNDRSGDPAARRGDAGQGRLKDLDLLLEIGDNIGIIPGTTIFGLADGAAWPIKNAVLKCPDELEGDINGTHPTR